MTMRIRYHVNGSQTHATKEKLYSRNMYSICINSFQILEPSENNTAVLPPILGYAKPGKATGKLLYVNYGRKEDFDALKNMPGFTNCSGYIAIMRYGKIYRGNKASDSIQCFRDYFI